MEKSFGVVWGQCSIPEVGRILALKHEKLDNKLQFQVFMEKMGTYVLSTFKDGGDIVPLFTKIVDPKPDFIKERRPVALTEKELLDPVEYDIYKARIKSYGTRDTIITRNMEKSSGVVWGQCSAALQARIK